MVVVFTILLFLILTGITIILSNIKIEIKYLVLETDKTKKQDNKYKINISIGLLGLKLFNYSINDKNLKELKKKYIFDKKSEDVKLSDINKKRIVNHIKKANIKLEKIDLNILIGFEDCAITAFLVGLLSAVLSAIISCFYDEKNSLDNYHYKIMPVYNKFFSKLNLNCIIQAKFVHIICIILLIWKGSREHERASNRKSYGYSYE